MTWNVPNILTVLRLLAAPAIALAFFVIPRPWADAVALILFVGASATDWVDGYLARSWNQTSRFGAMLDPIADKAMVALALLVLAGLSGLNWLVLIPAAAILFREVFVSGLREFIGSAAGTLKVTSLAKWKTTAQMVAISLLFAKGIAAHILIERTVGMDAAMAEAILAGEADDPLGLRWWQGAWSVLWYGGLVVLWVAAALTVITGWDYLRKAMPHLREPA
jgi:CDP-diacylglycerol--glycerol-3-phosphate 3-phosphatidyltransferase